MNCTACGAEVDGSGVFPGAKLACGACGAAVIVPAVDAAVAHPVAPASVRPSGNPCPRCQADLVFRDAEGVVVLACPEGHGLFVRPASLHAVERGGEPVAAALDLDTGPPIVADHRSAVLACPACGARMARHPLTKARIAVDICAKDGTWFDAGELRASVAGPGEAIRAIEITQDGERASLEAQQAAATLDVSLALEQVREESALRASVDTADDLLDTFNVLVLGRESRRRRY